MGATFQGLMMIKHLAVACASPCLMSLVTNYYYPSADGTMSTVWFGWNSVFSSVVLLVMCQLFMGVDRVPIALVAFLYGLVIALATHPEVLSELTWGISLPAPILPSKVRYSAWQWGYDALPFHPSFRLPATLFFLCRIIFLHFFHCYLILCPFLAWLAV